MDTVSSHLREFDKPSFANATFRLDRPSMYLVNRARRDEFNGYEKLKKSVSSATVYVGHLSLSTTEEQIFELFSSCGKIDKVIMGLNAHDQSPTGFCFVIYKHAKYALDSVKYLNKMKLNGRPVEIDLDVGFEEGRQYGRGENGAQKYQSYSSYGHGHGHGHGQGHGQGRGQGHNQHRRGRGRGRGGRFSRRGGGAIRGGAGRDRDRESGYEQQQRYERYQARNSFY